MVNPLFRIDRSGRRISWIPGGCMRFYLVLSSFCIFALAHMVCKLGTNQVLRFRKRYRKEREEFDLIL